jgi:hypothetical protein
MGLALSFLDRRAVKVEVRGYHRLGRTAVDGVLMNIGSTE